MQGTKDDPFEGLLELENTFYREGYELGVNDGKRAGLVEGRTFGLEKGFEKYASMGRINGKAVIWAGRLPPVRDRDQVFDQGQGHNHTAEDATATAPRELRELPQARSLSQAEHVSHAMVVPALADHLRAEKHVRTLYALVEMGSLSTDNTEEAVSDFDDRLKRADGKVKMIEKITGETSREESGNMAMAMAMATAMTMTMTMTVTGAEGRIRTLRNKQTKSRDGSIEDITSL